MSAHNTFERGAALEALRTSDLDVLIVGGGITGVGCVLDAASRGLRAGLIERDDFASGTSSKSSKLVHGGLRYLQQGEIRLVYEALHERRRLLLNAPHLVEVLPFLIPIFTGQGGVLNSKLARALGSAMWAYDLTGGWRIGKRHRRISVDATLSHMPTLDRSRLAPSYLYYDAQADDARLTLTIARTAALRFGAHVANGTRLISVNKDPKTGRVVSATVEADGNRFDIVCKAVVNAAGVWSDEVRTLDEGTNPNSIRPAKGVHITVPWRLVRNDIAVVIPVPKDKRSVFVVPWGEYTYVGTTDTDFDGDVNDPMCTKADVSYLLRALNAAMNSNLTVDDVVGTWAGLRPLVNSASSGRTADLSRRHKVRSSASGVVTITGGKLTTYREMAVDTIDAVIDAVPELESTRSSRTSRLKLQGAEGFDPKVHREGEAHRLARRYGSESHQLTDLIHDDPSLAEPIVDGLPYVKAEVVWAARHEMARSVDDVLSRRTRSRILNRQASDTAAETVASLLASELGWSEGEVRVQVEEYRAMVYAESSAMQS